MAVGFLLYVIAEVAAVWAVASAIGILATLALLIAGALVGSWLARREGGKAARAFMTSARSGRSPHAEMTDGMLIGLGGLLILVPGFVSDVLGLLVILPPTRGVVRRAWLRRAERHAPPGHPLRAAGAPGWGPGMRSQVIVVDSEVVSDNSERAGSQHGRDRAADVESDRSAGAKDSRRSGRDEGDSDEPPRIIEG